MDSLSIKILCDKIPRAYIKNENCAIYCLAHHKMNIDIMAKSLIALFDAHKQAYPVYILGNTTFMSGVPSFNEVRQIYEKYNIFVHIIPYSQSKINTRIECEAIINFFSAYCIQNVILVSPAFHSKRAYMTAVSVYLEKSPSVLMKIYSRPATIFDWSEETISHQGKTKCSFSDMVQLEENRIKSYTLKGDIKKADQIEEYVDMRAKKKLNNQHINNNNA